MKNLTVFRLTVDVVVQRNNETQPTLLDVGVMLLGAMQKADSDSCHVNAAKVWDIREVPVNE